MLLAEFQFVLLIGCFFHLYFSVANLVILIVIVSGAPSTPPPRIVRPAGDDLKAQRSMVMWTLSKTDEHPLIADYLGSGVKFVEGSTGVKGRLKQCISYWSLPLRFVPPGLFWM